MGAPKVSCEDIRLHLSGVYSGSSNDYWFWEQNINSGSMWSIISGSDVYLRQLCGDSVWDNTSADSVNNVKYLELEYVCFKTLVQLSGGIIVSGFDWSTGPIRVSQSRTFDGWQSLINQFKESAMNRLKNVQTFVLSYDWSSPTWDRTSNSPM